jgi:signal transduction histidine kinase
LPPLLYLGTVRVAENYFHKRYVQELENLYLGDARRLLDGNVRVKDAVSDNIHRYLRSKWLTEFGLDAKATVVTRKGTLLYPSVFEQPDEAGPAPSPMAVAAENYRLLQEEPVLTLDVEFEHLRLFPNLILGFYVLAAALALYLHYRLAARKYLQEEKEREAEIRQLLNREDAVSQRIQALDEEKNRLSTELTRSKAVLSDEKNRASRNEDDLLEEIENLESELKKTLGLKTEQQDEILALKDRIEQYERKNAKTTRRAQKSIQAFSKRFNALYKKISVNEHAVEGFADLDEQIKIKAEEIIHQLNENPDQVIVKRKVFIGKRDQKAVMEVIFGYKGRLYFWKNQAGTIEVLAVGDKNTQSRELSFLAKL